MSVSSVHHLHGIVFPDGTFLSKLEDATPATNTEEIVQYASGHPDPLFVANMQHRPDVQFTTPQVKSMLDLCAAIFAADLSAGNTDLYYKKATDLGVREDDGDGVHTRIRMPQGMVYWTDITASQGQTASLRGRVLPTYDGTNPPFVPVGNATLAGTPVADQAFTLGPVKFNGSQIQGIDEWRLSLGIGTTEIDADGEEYLTFAGIQQRQPVLELSSYTLGLWASHGLSGTALTSLVSYLRRKQSNQGTYANGSAQHISFTAASGKASIVDTKGSGNAPAKTTLRLPLRAPDPGNYVITIDTACVIS